MLDDLKKLLGADSEQFAAEVQKLSSSGQFDPFSMLAGELRWHSVFLAPFSPSLAEARSRFLADGTGPLAAMVQQKKDGMDPQTAAQNFRTVFERAEGMCVVVLAGDHGLDTIPQLFFGHLEEPYCQQVVQLCGEQFKHADVLKKALAALRQRAKAGATWPALHAGGSTDTVEYWCGLAKLLVAGIDAGMAKSPSDRLRELAQWINTAIGVLDKSGSALPVAHLSAALRVRALAGHPAEAFAGLDRMISAVDDEEALVTLVLQLGDEAIRQGKASIAAAWHGHAATALEKRFPRCYELRLARFKAVAAQGGDAGAIISAADALIEANRKNARHDLSREPVWLVTASDPGDVLDTAQAAELVGRSPAFIAKRLEHGTIPLHRHGDQVRLPREALTAWKAVMEKHRLLE